MEEDEASGWIVTMWTCPNCQDVNEAEGDCQGDEAECPCGWVGTIRNG